MYNDFKFNLHNTNNEGLSFFRCAEHKKQKCPARIKMNSSNDLAILIKDHNHDATLNVDVSCEF